MYQPVPLHIDKVLPSINQYRPIMTQYHHISTSTAFYWPSTTKYQPVPPPTDPVPPSTNRYHFLLTQCRHISNSTTRYRPSTNKYQPVPPHSVVTRGLQTPAQFTLGLVVFTFFLPIILYSLNSYYTYVLTFFLTCYIVWHRKHLCHVRGSFFRTLQPPCSHVPPVQYFKMYFIEVVSSIPVLTFGGYIFTRLAPLKELCLKLRFWA